jgi:pectate lyase
MSNAARPRRRWRRSQVRPGGTRSLVAALFLSLPCGLAGLVLAAGRGGPPAATPAFPEAEGFGVTPGGRGGRVIEVTNLDNDGPGSLRAALRVEGPRIVVFRVGGTIHLDSTLNVSNPYVTIAGQTAPGDGITLANSPRGARSPLAIKTHDVVVRYIRSRPGGSPADMGTIDALTISNRAPGNVYRVIVDHNSLSWATDEVCSIYYDAHDITVQWSILAEGLDCATHREESVQECHSMGLLVGGEGSGNVSLHHNLLAHNRHRNPKVRTTGIVDVVNNVVYNSGFGPGWLSPTYVHGGRGVARVNYVSNYFKGGVDTRTADWFIGTKLPVQIYVEGNAAPRDVVWVRSRDSVVARRHPAAAVTTLPAEVAYARVLAEAGASQGLGCDGAFYPRRDAADARIVSDVRNRTGRIIDDPVAVGGWPRVQGGEPCRDADHDGMPDVFERLRRLDPTDARDASRDPDGDGYTNLDDYLNGSRPSPPKAVTGRP